MQCRVNSAASLNETIDTALDEVINAKIYPQEVFLNDDDWNDRHNYRNERHRGGYDNEEIH